MKEQIISLFEYGKWVNDRVLVAAADLTMEQLARKVLPGFGSLHLTLVHMLGAEEIWLARWKGVSPQTMLSPTEFTEVAGISSRWEALHAERGAYLASLDEAGLEESLHWRNMRGQAYELPLWQLMLHCANHSTHHRSEVAAILTELGHEPDSTDLLEFYLLRTGQQWKPSRR